MSNISRKLGRQIQQRNNLQAAQLEGAILHTMLSRVIPLEDIAVLMRKVYASAQENPTQTLRDSVSHVMQEYLNPPADVEDTNG